MRILVVGAPASGLHVAARLVAKLCGLKLLSVQRDRIPTHEKGFSRFVEAGAMANDAVLAYNFAPDPALLTACQAAGLRIVCMTRNPYAMFEGMYQKANLPSRQQPDVDIAPLRGAELQSDAVKAFIKERYRAQLEQTSAWCSSGAAWHWRFEDLETDPEGSLERVAEGLGLQPVQPFHEVAAAVQSNRVGVRYSEQLADESRLPPAIVDAINQLIAPAASWLGYPLQRHDAAGVLAGRRHRFANFMQRYAETERVFVVGHGKSGTTWVHLMLFNHPNVAAVAERRLIEHPDGNSALFDQLLDLPVFRSWFDSSSFGKTNPAEESVRFELAGLMADYLMFRALALRRTDKGLSRPQEISHFSEKIAVNREEDAILTMENLGKIFPDARIIHIVRDPRDVAISGLFHIRRQAIEQNQAHWARSYVEALVKKGTKGPPYSRRVDEYLESVGSGWAKVVQAFHLSGTDKYPGRYHLVRYEDLLQEPRGRVVELLRFCGLDDSDQTLEAVLAKTAFKQLAAGRLPGEEDRSSFFRKGVAGDWMEYMGERKSRKLFAPARSLMEEFGYW